MIIESSSFSLLKALFVFAAVDEQSQIQEIMDVLQSVKTQSQQSDRKAAMTQLIRMAREGKTGVIQDHFK